MLLRRVAAALEYSPEERRTWCLRVGAALRRGAPIADALHRADVALELDRAAVAVGSHHGYVVTGSFRA